MKKLYIIGVLLLLIFSVHQVHADAYPDGCTATTTYSSTTGHLCTLPKTCAVGDIYNSQTGQPCNQNYLPGCSVGTLYSVLTGQKCDGSTPVGTAIATPLVAPVTTTTVYPVPTLALLPDQTESYANNAAFTLTNTAKVPVTITGISIQAGDNNPLTQSAFFRVYYLNQAIAVTPTIDISGIGQRQSDLIQIPFSISAGTPVSFKVTLDPWKIDSSLTGSTLNISLGLFATDSQGDTIIIPTASVPVSISQ